MENIFFDSWESILRTLIISVFAYSILIVMLRVSGKRTLSKMNSFDFIVTIALGSTLATVILNKNVALTDGLLALFMLIILQYIITYFSVRSSKLSDLVKSTPALLAYKGRLIHPMMRQERITQEEIMAVIREKGLGSLKDADAVVLETDGSLTVMSNIKSIENSVIEKVIKPGDIG